ncbi:hypothetical protein [Mesorhizobium sp.]|uniref:hypothetical protein n=1 Tax=Mesorhizobium sp. TaxID=1871066 RepID=UPI00120EF4B4|nr:hypothetical protein [Mesorhizobium sp.]TIN79754.1 MAG: hypothetical protein E5Y09_04775 [Mesorhizobium sp.]
MKDGLIEDIKSKGHWRVNIRPAADLAEKLSFAECRKIVADANVELRGWDYPHVLDRNDETTGYYNDAGFVENWTTWSTNREFWRMYQSGQFLHYRAFWEDRDQYKGTPQTSFLSIEGAIYTITEIVEFAARLRAHPAFAGGLLISVRAVQTANRALWVGERRISFFERKATQAPSVEVTGNLAAAGLEPIPLDLSLKMIQTFFDNFGWTPADHQIRASQDRLINRRF